ncbi:MAG: DUF58 domain-containing protein [Halanaeroarchaeum sp.]
MTPSPTRRGWTVLGVVLFAFAMGWGFGGRSLNAVVVPGIVAFALAGLGVWRVDRPTVERSVPEHGHRGESVTVGLAVESDLPMPATVTDVLPDGLAGDATRATVLDGRRHEYAVDLRERGVHRIAGPRVAVTDPLGLWRRQFERTVTDRITVFPRVRPLGRGAPEIGGVLADTDVREHFDGVREYVPGDPLRDVNWKTSAKRPHDLFVTEYAGTGESRSVTVGVTASEGHVDDAAEAAASVAVHLLDAGATVGVVGPNGEVEPAVGEPHRRRVLSLLATLDAGAVPDDRRDDVDVLVSATDADATQVVVGGDRRSFEDLAGRRQAGVPA